MNRVQRKQRVRVYKAEQPSIRKILKLWDPIPGSPDDEYECLEGHLLSVLHRGGSQDEVASELQHQFTDHFGISVTDEKIKQVSGEIFSWWQQSHSSPC